MKTVIEMARESKVVPVLLVPHGEYFKFLEHFAELVRADMKERCAKMCDQLALEDGLHQAKYCANAIRGRMDE